MIGLKNTNLKIVCWSPYLRLVCLAEELNSNDLGEFTHAISKLLLSAKQCIPISPLDATNTE